MIKRIRVKNYKSLRDVDLELGPFNVLIGPNASGKSNFLNLLQLIHWALIYEVDKPVIQQGGPSSVLWQGNKSLILSVEMRFKLDNYPSLVYYLEIAALKTGGSGVKHERLFVSNSEGGKKEEAIFEANWGEGKILNERTGEEVGFTMGRKTLALAALGYLDDYPTVSALRESIQNWAFYDIDLSNVRDTEDYTPDEQISYSGANLGSVLLTLKQQKPEVFAEIMDSLRRAIPFIEAVEPFFSSHTSRVHIELLETGLSKRFPLLPQNISDGTLRFLAYLAVLKLDDPPPLICIEEPDRSLHPQLMLHLRDAFRSAAERTQIIVTTHNADFVNYLTAEEVITVDRVKGESQFTPVSTVEDLQDWLEDYRLGEIWEMRLMGGVQ